MRVTASNCFGLSCFDRATVLLRFRQQRSEGGKIVAGLLVVGRRLGLVEYGENGRPVRRRNGGRPDRAGVADGGADQAGVSWLHARGNPSQVAAYHFRPGDEHFRQAFHAHRRAPRRRELIQKRERGLDFARRDAKHEIGRCRFLVLVVGDVALERGRIGKQG